MTERESTGSAMLAKSIEQGAALAAKHEGILDIEPGRARSNLRAIKEFQAVVREVLVEGQDYGTIPGTQKPTLYKPGAEKITKLLNLYEEYEFIERVEDWDRPLFHYIIRCTLSDIATGTRVSSGLGACNSRESRYRYRWLNESQLSETERALALKKRGGKTSLFEPAFAIEKKETGGQYGKPIEHWQRFEDAIKNMTARAVMKKTKAGKDLPGFEIDVDTTLYQVENPDIFDLVNTMVKIAKKRAHIDATLSAGRLSELFTQDLEDFADVAGAGIEQAPPQKSAEQIERERYEAQKKEPLKNIKDEFTDPPPPEDEAPAQGDQPTMAQLERYGKAKADLEMLGIRPEKIWTGVLAFVAKTYNREIADLSDLTQGEMEMVNGYLSRWKGAKEADAKKAADGKR
jgi:hypothetical protein